MQLSDCLQFEKATLTLQQAEAKGKGQLTALLVARAFAKLLPCGLALLSGGMQVPAQVLSPTMAGSKFLQVLQAAKITASGCKGS